MTTIGPIIAMRLRCQPFKALLWSMSENSTCICHMYAQDLSVETTNITIASDDVVCRLYIFNTSSSWANVWLDSSRVLLGEQFSTQLSINITVMRKMM